jgi:hypothetical protein
VVTSRDASKSTQQKNCCPPCSAKQNISDMQFSTSDYSQLKQNRDTGYCRGTSHYHHANITPCSILSTIWMTHEAKHWKSGTASQPLLNYKLSYSQDSAHHQMQSYDSRKDRVEIHSRKGCMMNLSHLALLCK